jgi:hypothetical protein
VTTHDLALANIAETLGGAPQRAFEFIWRAYRFDYRLRRESSSAATHWK